MLLCYQIMFCYIIICPFEQRYSDTDLSNVVFSVNILIDCQNIGNFVHVMQQQKQEQGGSKKSAKRNLKHDDGEENPDDFVDPETPHGERKRMSKLMAKQYNPTAVEKS